MFRRSLVLLIAVPGILAAQSAASAAGGASFVVARGPLGTVYEAYPAMPGPKLSDGCAADIDRKTDIRYGPQAFEDGLTFAGASSDPSCTAVGVTVSQNGLVVRFLRLGDPKVAAAADDLPFAPDSEGVVTVSVNHRACATGPGMLVYLMNAEQKGYVEDCGRSAPWAAGTLEKIERKAGSKQKWFGVALTIPWAVLELPYGTAHRDISVKCCTVATPTFGKTANVTIEMMRAYDGIVPAKAMRFADDDQRSATLTQYYRYAAPDTTPPGATCPCIVIGGVSYPRFALTTPTTPAPAPSRVGSPSAEINTVLSQGFVLSGALAQSASVPSGTETAIKDVISGAIPSPKPSLPSVPCDACGTFQSLNAAFFKLPGATSRLTALPDSFGADDTTFKLATIGDLVYGGLLKTGGPYTQYGLAKMSIADSSQFDNTDATFALAQARGAATLNVVVASVNKPPVAPPQPGAPPGVVMLSHTVNYALAVGDEHKWNKGDAGNGSASAFASFGRLAWDATDKALNGAAGFQARRAFTGGGASSSVLASVGYRATDVGYTQLDGSAVSVPGVSGPFGALQFNRTPADWTNPVYDVVVSGYSYRSSSDHAMFLDGKIASALSSKSPLSVYFEAQDSRQTPPIAAASLIAKGLGSDPYRSAVNLLPAPYRFIDLPGRDRTFGLQYAPEKSRDTQINVSVGWDFEHVVPSCLFGAAASPIVGAAAPSQIVTCLPALHSSKQLTASGYIAIGSDFTLAGSFKPTFFEGVRAAGQSTAVPPTKVYSLLASVRLNECDSVILAATNDIEAVTPATLNNVSKTFQAELNTKRYLGLFSDDDVGAPTLVLGVSNSFGFAQAGYNIVPAPGQVLTGSIPIVQFPYETHAFTAYIGLRFANRAFRASTAPDPRCAPRKKPR